MIGSLNEFTAFCAARGVAVTTEAAAVLLQKATDYMNMQSWIGDPVDEDQEDAWPRILPGDDGVITDENKNPLDLGDGVPLVAGILPKKILTATYRLGMVAKTIDLLPSYAGPAVIEKRIEGAITTKYAEATLQSAPVFEWFDLLVGKWLADEGCGFQFPVRRG